MLQSRLRPHLQLCKCFEGDFQTSLTLNSPDSECLVDSQPLFNYTHQKSSLIFKFTPRQFLPTHIKFHLILPQKFLLLRGSHNCVSVNPSSQCDRSLYSNVIASCMRDDFSVSSPLPRNYFFANQQVIKVEGKNFYPRSMNPLAYLFICQPFPSFFSSYRESIWILSRGG